MPAASYVNVAVEVGGKVELSVSYNCDFVFAESAVEKPKLKQHV
jgi:hypothetical protein